MPKKKKCFGHRNCADIELCGRNVLRLQSRERQNIIRLTRYAPIDEDKAVMFN